MKLYLVTLPRVPHGKGISREFIVDPWTGTEGTKMSSIARKKRRPNGSNARNKDLQHQKLIKSVDSFLRSIASFDLRLTKKCSICADTDSSFGNLRPLMKAMEISCHGIPWIVGTILMLLTVHKADHIEILVNLLIGKLTNYSLFRSLTSNRSGKTLGIR